METALQSQCLKLLNDFIFFLFDLVFKVNFGPDLESDPKLPVKSDPESDPELPVKSDPELPSKLDPDPDTK